MNAFMVSIGLTLIALFMMVFIGPFLIDWNGYRDVLEARLSAVIGQQVMIGGPVEIRLLPIPEIYVSDVSVYTHHDNAALLKASSVRMRVYLAPLLHGELRVEELHVDDPIVQLFSNRNDMRSMLDLKSGQWSVIPNDISLTLIRIRNGTVIVRNEAMGRDMTFENIDLLGEVKSLDGPFRFDGDMSFGGKDYALRWNAGQIREDHSMKMRLALDSPLRQERLIVDGDMNVSVRNPVFDGRIELIRDNDENGSGHSIFLNGFDADMKATLDGVTLSGISLRVGRADRSVDLAGEMSIAFKDALSVRTALSVGRLNLDYVLTSSPGRKVNVRDAMRMLGQSVRHAAAFSIPVDLRFDAQSIVLNERVIENVSIDADFDDGDIEIDSLHLTLPGRTRLSAPGLGHMPQKMTARGKLHVSDARSGVEDLVVEIDGSKFRGEGTLLLDSDGYALDLNVHVDRLDLDRYVAIDRLVSGIKHETMHLASFPRQLDMRLSADVLRVGGVEIGDLAVDIECAIDQCMTGDEAYSGRVYGKSRATVNAMDDVSITAWSSLSGLRKELVAALFDHLQAAAPVKLDADVFAIFASGGLSARLVSGISSAVTRGEFSFFFDGSLDDTSGGQIKADLSLSGWDALVRTIRPDWKSAIRDTARDTPIPSGTIKLTLDGVLQTGAPLLVEVDMPGGKSIADGILSWSSSGPAYRGTIDWRGTDARPLLRLFNLPKRFVPYSLYGIVRMNIVWDEGAWRFDIDQSMICDNGISGYLFLKYPDDSGDPALSGTLDIERIDTDMLRVLVPNPVSSVGGPMGTRLDRQSFDGLDGDFDLERSMPFSVAVELRSRRFMFPHMLEFNDMTLKLNMGRRGTDIFEINAGLGDGRLTAHAELSPSPSGFAMQAAFDLESVDLKKVWSDVDESVATGILNASVRLSGKGRDLTGLIDQLTGDGVLSIDKGMLQKLSPKAFHRMESVDILKAGLNKKKIADTFDDALAAAPLRYQRFEGRVIIADGFATLQDAMLRANDMTVRMTGRLDLSHMSVDSEWYMSPATPDGPIGDHVDKDLSVRLFFFGPVGQTRRRLDIDSLMNFLLEIQKKKTPAPTKPKISGLLFPVREGIWNRSETSVRAAAAEKVRLQ